MSILISLPTEQHLHEEKKNWEWHAKKGKERRKKHKVCATTHRKRRKSDRDNELELLSLASNVIGAWKQFEIKDMAN